MPKVKVHTTEKVRRRVIVRQERWRLLTPQKPPHGVLTQNFDETETAELECTLEVYLDLEKLLTYARKAMENSRQRFVRGPIEVRAVNVKEVPDTREVKNPKPAREPDATDRTYGGKYVVPVYKEQP